MHRDRPRALEAVAVPTRNCLPRKRTMTDPTARPMRCAVYTRKSTEHNLDLAFTSLDAQREACEALYPQPGR